MPQVHPTPESAFERGLLLRNQQRTADAVDAFIEALGMDPDHAPSMKMLALCRTELEGEEEAALATARRAVALEPEDAFARTVLAVAQARRAKGGQKGKLREALQSAEAAAALDPDSDFAHSVRAGILLQLERYPEAERAAKRGLEVDPENSHASEVLSAALLLQAKSDDNVEVVDYHLKRSPGDDSAHTGAGWQALMAGDYRTANKHFLEALRLNPMNERARMGLIESFRARSRIYRLQLRFANFMNRFSGGQQTAILIGGFIFYKVAYGSIATVSPLLGNVVIGLWLSFALWSHLARGLSTFFICLDRFARQALTTKEKWEGLAVGGLISLAGLSLLSSVWLSPEAGGLLALGFLFAAVANAAAFTNDHWRGKYVYAAAAVFCTVSVFYFVAAALTLGQLPGGGAFLNYGLLVGVAVTWLRALGVEYA